MAKYERLVQVIDSKEGASAESESAFVERDEAFESLQEEVAQAKKAAQTRKVEQEKITGIWVAHIQKLEEALDAKKAEVVELKLQIKSLATGGQEFAFPPGPQCLHFVDGDAFLLLGMLVVVANGVTVLLEFTRNSFTAELYALDQFFLSFYIVELLLKACYHQQRLLFGSCGVVWWNWFDLANVVLGCFSAWVMPAVVTETQANGNGYMFWVRVLRLLRLVRIVKLIKAYVQSDFEWAEGDMFQTFIMAVIAFNAILMGVELETPELGFMWAYVEHFLLAIFTFELTLRLRARGASFFLGRDVVWNTLDFVVVLGGVVDQWLLPSIYFVRSLARAAAAEEKSPVDVKALMNLLRMARLLRILRLVRVIRCIPPLYSLVVGIYKAMQGMAWVLVLTLTVLYVCALMGVKLAGPQGLLWPDGDTELPADAADAFPDLWGAVFNLFKVMNGDFGTMSGLCDYAPYFKLVCMLYVIVTNWAIFSILTAVVCDNMSKVTEELSAEEKAAEKEFKSTELVNSIFDEMDIDDSGAISERELKAFLSQEEKAKDVCEAADMKPDDLKELFDIFCEKGANHEATLRRDVFIEGVKKDGQGVTQLQFMKVEKSLAATEKSLELLLTRLKGALGAAAACAPPR